MEEFIKKPFWVNSINDVAAVSKNLGSFLSKCLGIENEYIPLENLRSYYKSDKQKAYYLIKELAFRGFEFNSLNPNNILPKVQISDNPQLIFVSENKNVFKEIPFLKYGYGNITENFLVSDDLFFNLIPVEGFKYISNEGKVNLLLSELKNYSNFSIGLKIEKTFSKNCFIESKDLEILIDDLFCESYFKLFRKICDENRIHSVGELVQINLDLFISKSKGMGRRKKQLIKKKLEKYTNNNNGLNIPDPNSDVLNKLIKDYFYETTFGLFRKACEKEGLLYVRDLKNISLEYFLSTIKGFGNRKIKLVSDEVNRVFSKNSVNSTTKIDLEDPFNFQEVKFQKKFALDILDNISIEAFFNDQYFKSLITKLKNDYGIHFMRELAEFEVDEVLNCFSKDELSPQKRKKINNFIADYKSRRSYGNKYLFLSKIFNDSKYIKILKIFIKEELFDIRDLNSVVLGDLIKKHKLNGKEAFKDFMIQYCQSYDKYSLPILKIPKERIVYFDIFCERYLNKKTLEEIAKEKGLTRERIRQCEKMSFDGFESYFSVIDEYLVSKVRLIKENESSIVMFDIEDIVEISKEVDITFPLIFKAAIKEDCSAKIKYLKYLDKFVVGITPDLFEKRVNKLMNDHFSDDIINKVGLNLDELLTEHDLDFMSADDFFKILKLKKWKHIGQFIIQGKITLKKIFEVISHYFPEGISCDENGMNKLRKCAITVFDNNVLSKKSDRSIEGFLAKSYVLCGKRKYIHPSKISIDTKLLLEAKKYIDELLSNESIVGVQTSQLYDKFKEKLYKEYGIDNEYYFYGIFKYYFNDDYFFKKAIRKKESKGKQIFNLFEEYFLNARKPVAKEEVMHDLNIKNFTVANYSGFNKNILPWEQFGSFIHVKNFFEDWGNEKIVNFKNKLKLLLEESMQKNCEAFPGLNGYTNSNQVFNSAKILYLENKIPNSYSLFSVIEYFLYDCYYFARPHILKDKPNDGFSFHKIFEYFLNRNRVFTFSDFENFYGQISGNSDSSVVSNTFIIHKLDLFEIDQGEYTAKKNIFLAQENIPLIISFIENHLENEEYLPILSIDNFSFLPDLEFKWNAFLMKSLVEGFFPQYKIIKKESENWKFNAPILVRASSSLQKIDELFIHILKKRYNGTCHINEFELYLAANKLIYRSLPKEFLQSEKVSINKEGVVYIK